MLFMQYLIKNFNQTIDKWIGALAHYEDAQLLLQPEPASWSLGQVYMHLLEEAKFHIIEMETCLANDHHAAENMTEYAKSWFQNNDFPNEKLIGFSNPPQPTSKAQLLKDMTELKMAVNTIGQAIGGSTLQGKTQHPGHQYFSAVEWFQYAEMHFRHHLRQKERIDYFLDQHNK